MPRIIDESQIRFPNLLKQKRIALDLTPVEMASLIGVGLTTVYRWESGQSWPKSKPLQRLVFQHYGTSPMEAYPTCYNMFSKEFRS